jgi:hypothetical protein
MDGKIFHMDIKVFHMDGKVFHVDGKIFHVDGKIFHMGRLLIIFSFHYVLLVSFVSYFINHYKMFLFPMHYTWQWGFA